MGELYFVIKETVSWTDRSRLFSGLHTTPSLTTLIFTTCVVPCAAIAYKDQVTDSHVTVKLNQQS